MVIEKFSHHFKEIASGEQQSALARRLPSNPKLEIGQFQRWAAEVGRVPGSINERFLSFRWVPFLGLAPAKLLRESLRSKVVARCKRAILILSDPCFAYLKV